ncbi:MAG: hypothetical protein IIB54_08810 [Planctomycetes bacterium]|nr:hypothetical protein [Planctomycetota bacterium]
MFKMLSTLLIAIAALSPAARGVVTVTGDDGLAIPMVNYNIEDLGNNHFNVTVFGLYNPFGDTVYEIHGNVNDTVDNLIINVDGPPAASPVIVRVLDIRSVGNILQTGTGETILNIVRVTEDIGTITVETIGELLAGRDVTGNIVATTSDNPDRGITTIKVGINGPGSILGDLSAVNGKIQNIIAFNGSVGTAANPITIDCKYNITKLSADSVHANINTRLNNGPGMINALRAREFSGSINTNDLGPTSTAVLHVAEDFSATVSIAGSFTGAGKKIQVPENGFSGQIIFNADNTTSVWDAPVHIIQPDPTDPLDETLATIIDTLAPSYTNTAAAPG